MINVDASFQANTRTGGWVLLQEIIMEFFWKEGVAIWSIF